MTGRRIAVTGLAALASFAALGAPAAHGAFAQTMASHTYQVTVTNLTAKQVLSPPVLATHPASAHVWQMGQTASDGIKLVAEEGDGSVLVASLKGIATDVQMGAAPIMPGKSATFTIMAHDGDVLSAASMLVETNDGFTGLDNMTLAAAMTDKDTMAYDGGVEENTEKATDVPGPPFGGHNSGPQTEPRQPIAMHMGITGKADVGTEYNWSGAVARFSVHMVTSGDTGMMGGTSSGTASGTGGTMAPGMPDTGSGDTGPWALLAAASAALIAGGLSLRRAQTQKR
jgi:hypothetical protein